MRHSLSTGLFLAVAALSASPAHAHAPIPGIKGFYVGLLHPFSTPVQALVMVGLGLLAASFKVEQARWVLVAFLICSLVGVAIGSADWQVDMALFATAILACGFAALGQGRLLPMAVLITLAGGVLIGVVSLPDAGLMRDRVVTMSGSIVGANVGLLYLFGAMHFVKERYKWPWVTVAFQIAAAWLGAIALLMLALGYVEVAPTV